MNKKAVGISLLVAVAVMALLISQLGLYTVQPIGAVPEGVTAIVRRAHMGQESNSSQRVKDNIRTASSRMRRVDNLLGEQRLLQFADGAARILAHGEPSGDGLCAVLADKGVRLEAFIQLFNAAVELETAWNAVRLCNVPASQRQGRVACESIAVAVLFSLPSSTLRDLPLGDPLADWLRAHPDKTAVDAYEPRLVSADEPQRMQPAVNATHFFSSFVKVAELVLQLPPDVLQGIRQYRERVQHPASHASAELFTYHFETLASGAAGAVFDPKRSATYVQAADDLSQIAHLLADILDRATQHLALNP